ncbi:hypothetical protein [Paenibacillus sp. 1P07SE]|uniref:hypothetical protein n=1 Tax=Paenibacillus sp. 1P07SE TaxID=3132209 RepID=UPI0039A54D8A
MKKLTILLCLLSIISISGCGNPKISTGTNSSADWAYSFVIWNDDIYEITDEKIDQDQIGKELGEIKQFSDTEGIYDNGFSNRYPPGTKLYSIKGVELSEYIAIRNEDDSYIKAIDQGKYGG